MTSLVSWAVSLQDAIQTMRLWQGVNIPMTEANTDITGGVDGPVLSGTFQGSVGIGQGGQGGEIHNYIYPPSPLPQLPPLQQNDALDTRITRLYEAFQHLESRLYYKWSADAKLHELDMSHRATRQHETDQYRRVVLWWLAGLTGIVVVLISAILVIVFSLGGLLQRFGWL